MRQFSSDSTRRSFEQQPGNSQAARLFVNSLARDGSIPGSVLQAISQPASYLNFYRLFECLSQAFQNDDTLHNDSQLIDAIDVATQDWPDVIKKIPPALLRQQSALSFPQLARLFRVLEFSSNYGLDHDAILSTLKAATNLNQVVLNADLEISELMPRDFYYQLFESLPDSVQSLRAETPVYGFYRHLARRSPPALMRLTLPPSVMSHADVQRIVQAPFWRQLRQLDLSDVDLEDADSQSEMLFAHGMPELRSLAIDFQINDSSVRGSLFDPKLYPKLAHWRSMHMFPGKGIFDTSHRHSVQKLRLRSLNLTLMDHRDPVGLLLTKTTWARDLSVLTLSANEIECRHDWREFPMLTRLSVGHIKGVRDAERDQAITAINNVVEAELNLRLQSFGLNGLGLSDQSLIRLQSTN